MVCVPGTMFSVGDPRSGHSDPASPSYNVGGGGSSSHSDDDSRVTTLHSEGNSTTASTTLGTVTAFLPNAQRSVVSRWIIDHGPELSLWGKPRYLIGDECQVKECHVAMEANLHVVCCGDVIIKELLAEFHVILISPSIVNGSNLWKRWHTLNIWWLKFYWSYLVIET